MSKQVWKGGKGLFRVRGQGGTASMRHCPYNADGSLADGSIVASVAIPGETVISLSPGEVSFDACDAAGQPVNYTANFELVQPEARRA